MEGIILSLTQFFSYIVMLRKHLFLLLCFCLVCLTFFVKNFLRLRISIYLCFIHLSQRTRKISWRSWSTPFFWCWTFRITELVLIIQPFIDSFLFLHCLLYNFYWHFDRSSMIRTFRHTSLFRLRMFINFLRGNFNTLRCWPFFMCSRFRSRLIFLTRIQIFCRLEKAIIQHFITLFRFSFNK